MDQKAIFMHFCLKHFLKRRQMSDFGVKQFQIAVSVSLVIREPLRQQRESIDSFVVYEKKSFTYPFLSNSERICLQSGNLSSKQAVVWYALDGFAKCLLYEPVHEISNMCDQQSLSSACAYA